IVHIQLNYQFPMKSMDFGDVAQLKTAILVHVNMDYSDLSFFAPSFKVSSAAFSAFGDCVSLGCFSARAASSLEAFSAAGFSSASSLGVSGSADFSASGASATAGASASATFSSSVAFF